MREAAWLACGDPAEMIRDMREWADPCPRCDNTGWQETFTPIGIVECQRCDEYPRAKFPPDLDQLLGCAFARSIEHLLHGEPALVALAVAERFARKESSPKELERGRLAATDPIVWVVCFREVWPGLLNVVEHVLGRLARSRDAERGAIRTERLAAASAELAAVYPSLSGRPFQEALRRRAETIDAPLAEAENQARHADMRSLADIVRDVVGNPWSPFAVDAAWMAAHGDLPRAMARDIIDRRAFAEVGVLGDALEEAGYPDEYAVRHCREGRHWLGCRVLEAFAAG